jgi:hypothetical protein
LRGDDAREGDGARKRQATGAQGDEVGGERWRRCRDAAAQDIVA